MLIAEYLHEICSFNPVPTRYTDFFVHHGDAILEYHGGIRTEISGALDVLRSDSRIEIVPTFSARGITSGGVIPREDFLRIESEWKAALQAAGEVDAVYLCLHGATAAEGEHDPEGRLLEVSRQVLGESIPIVASFDLHGILTDKMLRHCDAITVYHTYPHVDFFETGERAARLLLQILDGKIRPVTARVEIPSLVRGDELLTDSGIFGTLIHQAKEIQNGPKGLSAGFFIGNPFTDVPELRSNAVVVTDDDPDLARDSAIHLAKEFWPHRQQMQAQLVPLPKAVDRALQSQRQVALVDAADATSSGASGDSAEIFFELLERNIQKKGLFPLVDAPAVEAAFQAGIGAQIGVPIGGSLDPGRFRRRPVQACVRMLSDGRFRSESFGQEWNSGRTAVLETGTMTLVITTRPVHLFDRSLFLAHGQDPKKFDLTVVKSPHCQKWMYADWCEMINVDAPGSTSANLPTLGHRLSRRPVFPLDSNFDWEPTAKLFSRKC